MPRRKDPTNIIVYHASSEETPPHVLAQNNKSRHTFHAGTEDAALDRASFIDEADYYNNPIMPDSPSITGFMHKYQIRTRPSMLTYEDPHKSGYDHQDEAEDHLEELAVKEHSTSRINKYINRWEDPGSVSYVIPHQLVDSKHVKYLSTEKFELGRE